VHKSQDPLRRRRGLASAIIRGAGDGTDGGGGGVVFFLLRASLTRAAMDYLGLRGQCLEVRISGGSAC
jgi:hypothetical protein